LAKGDRHEIIKEDSYNFSGSDCAILFTCVDHSLDIEEDFNYPFEKKRLTRRWQDV